MFSTEQGLKTSISWGSPAKDEQGRGEGKRPGQELAHVIVEVKTSHDLPLQTREPGKLMESLSLQPKAYSEPRGLRPQSADA